MEYIDDFFGYPIPQFLQNILIAIIAILIGIILKFIIRKLFKLFSRFWPSFQIRSIIRHLNAPVSVFIPLLLLNISLGFMVMDKIIKVQISRIVEISLTITFSIILIRIIKVLEDYFYHKYDLKKEDNLKERKIRTAAVHQKICCFINCIGNRRISSFKL